MFKSWVVWNLFKREISRELALQTSVNESVDFLLLCCSFHYESLDFPLIHFFRDHHLQKAQLCTKGFINDKKNLNSNIEKDQHQCRSLWSSPSNLSRPRSSAGRKVRDERLEKSGGSWCPDRTHNSHSDSTKLLRKYFLRCFFLKCLTSKNNLIFGCLIFKIKEFLISNSKLKLGYYHIKLKAEFVGDFLQLGLVKKKSNLTPWKIFKSEFLLRTLQTSFAKDTWKLRPSLSSSLNRMSWKHCVQRSSQENKKFECLIVT